MMVCERTARGALLVSARTPGVGRRAFGGGPGACRLRGQESEVDGMDLLGELLA
ncbi:hypothetical protein [Ktedonobacter robiniae]|uniref:hypothetical protein n=1 Tax=Ktedonobacter robiniae TaxID=2778365 RepID=UPI001916B372|nr:hypothetical protein [Ktedonobacter robiniae]